MSFLLHFILQRGFFIGEVKDQNRLWPIPLNTTWQGLPETLTEEVLVIPNFGQLAAENQGPLRFNTENTAHYITDYQGQLLSDLMSEMSNLDNTSLLQIIQERRLLAEAGLISYAELVELIAQLDAPKSYIVSAAIETVIKGLDRFIDEETLAEKSFNRLITSIFQEDYNQLGFDKKADESDEDEMVRQIVLSLFLKINHQAVSERAHAIFDQYEDDICKLPAAIRRFVLINQMKHFETEALVDIYFDTYISTKDNNLRNDLTVALAHTKSSSTLRRIEYSLKDKDIIKPQDLAFWYMVLLSQHFTQESIWEWARENWDWIKAALGGDMSFDKFVIYPASYFKTPERLAEFKAFFEPQLSDMAINRNITMGINEITARVKLIEEDKAAVHEAVSQY
ncbi:membrane alanyl aminopeptidase domain protein [Streptococcus ictaluri 707-05]|uniref:Membrane alanyl aminopeptidase domain protein n=1 Tax=Streptococcus ictaluri 707-05 TaxID=764299 RepID=G5K2W2_9STRE|nr:membrane alanyl aminopeptidase domain protein [Streptococcus ictaluri 707-05]